MKDQPEQSEPAESESTDHPRDEAPPGADGAPAADAAEPAPSGADEAGSAENAAGEEPAPPTEAPAPPPPPLSRGGIVRRAGRLISTPGRSTHVRPRPPEKPASAEAAATPKDPPPSGEDEARPLAESTGSTGSTGPAVAADAAGVAESPSSTAPTGTGEVPPPPLGKSADDVLPPEPAPAAPPGGEGGVQEGAVPVDEPPARSTASPSPATLDAAPYLSVLEVREMDWDAVRDAVADPVAGERAERIIARMEEKLEGRGLLGLAFEEYASGPDDRAIHIGEKWPLGDVWFIGDVHGDLLALEAALQHIERGGGGSDAQVVLLGDLFDDGVHAAEVVLRVFELLLDGPMRVTVLAGNHDEALAFSEGRFSSTVLPSDFTDWLNANLEHPWAARLGRLIIRFFERMPRALFFPDGLLVAHGGVPHTDLHEELAREGNWNDPRVLQDFVWLRAHPRARKRIPNRTTRGSEFGREDFSAFCALAEKLGRPVERMLRGHDHVEERFAVYPAWERNPALTINTLSHRLPREVFGEYERVPVVARWVRGELPEVRRLFIPPALIREIYPEPVQEPDVREEEAG